MIVLLFIVIIRLIVIQLSSCLSIYMYLPLFIPFDMRNMFFSINKNICANIFYYNYAFAMFNKANLLYYG